jgi:hypothetical protein
MARDRRHLMAATVQFRQQARPAVSRGADERDIEGVTQRMLSQTLKQMERDGLITRTVLPTTPVCPPRLMRPPSRA